MVIWGFHDNRESVPSRFHHGKAEDRGARGGSQAVRGLWVGEVKRRPWLQIQGAWNGSSAKDRRGAPVRHSCGGEAGDAAQPWGTWQAVGATGYRMGGLWVQDLDRYPHLPEGLLDLVLVLLLTHHTRGRMQGDLQPVELVLEVIEHTQQAGYLAFGHGEAKPDTLQTSLGWVKVGPRGRCAIGWRTRLMENGHTWGRMRGIALRASSAK